MLTVLIFYNFFLFQIWYTCLGGKSKLSNFTQFDEIFDLPEQSIVRADSRALVGKFIFCDILFE